MSDDAQDPPRSTLDTPNEAPKDATRHGWLNGQLLIAMPQMGDARFEKALVFVCAHDAKGAMGLIVNKAIPDLTLATLLDELLIDHDSDVFGDFPVLVGGPVETTRGFLLHSGEFNGRDTIRVRDDYAVTGTIEALRAAMGKGGPQDKMFALGYAGWGAGQLEDEIRNNAWLVCDARRDLVFGHDQTGKWDKALAFIGINPALFSGESGHA